MTKFDKLFRFKGSLTQWESVKSDYCKDGNLVFAELLDEAGVSVYYHIYAGGAESTLVTKEKFDASWETVSKHEAMLKDIPQVQLESGETTWDGAVKAYVDGAIEGVINENIKTSSVAVADGSKAQLGVTSSVEGLHTTYTLDVKVADAITSGASGLATAGQVADAIATGVSGLASTSYVDDAITKLGNVMEFKGVVESVPAVPEDLTDYEYNVGDVITVQSTGEEYVFDGAAWIEIGKVSITEAVTSLTGSTYVTVAGEGESAAKTGNVTVSVEVGEIKENGKAGLALASDVYEAVEAAKSAATVTGASGYLTLDGKTVVIDAAQVATGTTSTDSKLATAGYVDDKVAEASAVAAKHSTVTTDTPTYVGVTTSVDATTGGTSYHVNLSDAALAAANHTIETITIDGQTATTATTVQAALQDLFESDKVASEGINQNHEDILAHTGATADAHAASAISYAGADGSTATDVEAALDDLFAKVSAVSTTVSGETASYSEVTGDFANGFTVKNQLATSDPTVAADKVSGNTATGLATDAYVRDYIESRLVWNVIGE
jgi:hypothetical protein